MMEENDEELDSNGSTTIKIFKDWAYQSGWLCLFWDTEPEKDEENNEYLEYTFVLPSGRTIDVRTDMDGYVTFISNDDEDDEGHDVLVAKD
jgi:hypothetical protein